MTGWCRVVPNGQDSRDGRELVASAGVGPGLCPLALLKGSYRYPPPQPPKPPRPQVCYLGAERPKGS